MAGLIKNDREQSARVRRLLLNEIERYFTADPISLSGTETGIKRELLLRMAANTLPRLHEHTGEDGDPIKYEVINYANNQGTLPSETVSDSVTTSV